MSLGYRLQQIADMVPETCRSVADIGADHALLPIYLMENGKIDYAVIGELRRKPFLRARAAVKETRFAHKISVRSGDGLEVLMPGEVDTVILAGLGGDVIYSILNQLHAATFLHYILQPMSRAYKVRSFCAKHGWKIEQEVLLCDNQRYYTVLMIMPGDHPYVLTDPELEYGPLILQQRDELSLNYFHFLYTQNERMLSNLRNCKDNIQLEELVKVRLRALEELINGSTT